MTIAEQLTTDMATSMKAGTAERTAVLRLLRSSMKNEEIKLGHALTDDEAMKVLQREAKQRRDSIEAYQKAERPELAAHEQSELTVIATYLPTALTRDELAKIVDEVVAAHGATDMKAMGAVIGAVMAKAGAAAEGGVVSQLVRERLGA